MRVFVTRNLPGFDLDRLHAEHDVEVWPGRLPPGPRELLDRSDGVDGLLTLLTDRIDVGFLDARPRLRAISNYAVGYENIDTRAATVHDIPVGHTPGVLTEATAQLALTMVLSLIRRVGEADQSVRRGDWLTWEPHGFLGKTFSETTLGLIGYGRIGRAVARMAGALGFEVIYSDPSAPESVSTSELLARSDVVSLHTLLTPETVGLMNRQTIARMKRGAMLVNVSRGPMIDVPALVEALESGHLSGAALDVTDPEPLPSSHPLLSLPNVIITPHIASAATSTRELMTRLAVDNLLAGLRGDPMPHCANPEVYEIVRQRDFPCDL